MDMPKYTEDCKGCKTYQETKESGSSGLDCTVAREGFIERCPCRTCIVKSMCSKACEEYDKVIRPNMRYGIRPGGGIVSR